MSIPINFEIIIAIPIPIFKKLLPPNGTAMILRIIIILILVCNLTMTISFTPLFSLLEQHTSYIPQMHDATLPHCYWFVEDPQRWPDDNSITRLDNELGFDGFYFEYSNLQNNSINLQNKCIKYIYLSYTQL